MDSSIRIYRVVIDKLDEESINNNLKMLKGLPIKIFVNCKNSKRECGPEGGEDNKS